MKSIKIKSFLKVLLFLPIAMGMVNCSEDWLKPKPLSIFTPENAFVDARGMYGALTACERNMRYEWYGDGAPIITELVFSDQLPFSLENGTKFPTDLVLLFLLPFKYYASTTQQQKSIQRY